MLKLLSALFLWLTMITVLMSSPVDDFTFDTRVLGEDPQYIYNRTLSAKSNTLRSEDGKTTGTPPLSYFPIPRKYSNPAILDDVVYTASHPPNRDFFFTPPLPRDINFPFADKPTLRGSNSENVFSSRRPQPPMLPPKAGKERIPIKRPDLLNPVDTKKKTINTPSMQKLPETFNFSETSNNPSCTTVRNINNTLDVVGSAVKNISLSSILRILNNKPDFGGKPRLEPELKISKTYYSVSTFKPTQPTTTTVIEKKYEDPPIIVLPNNDIDMYEEIILKEQQVLENKNTDFNSKSVPESSVMNMMEQSKPRTRYILGLAWDVHVYLVAVLFAILAGVSMLSVIRIKNHKWLLPYGHFLAVNGLLAIIGIVRCVYLFYDAYNIRKSLSQPVDRLWLNIVFPLIVCIFTIMFSFILKFVDVKAETYFFGKTNALFSLVILYAICSVGVDLYADLTAYASTMMLLSHCFFVLMCVLLGVSYILFYKTTSRKQSSIYGTAFRDPLPPSLEHASRIMLATSLLSLLMAAIQLIDIFCVYDPLGKDRLHPWLWWAFQLSVRVLEVSICFLILWAAMQPLHRDDGKETKGNSASRFSLFSWGTADTPRSGEQTYGGESIHVYSLRCGKQTYEDVFQDPVPMHLLNHGTSERYPTLESTMRSNCGTLAECPERTSPSMLIGEKGVVRFRSIADAALQDEESFSRMHWNQADDNHCIS